MSLLSARMLSLGLTEILKCKLVPDQTRILKEREACAPPEWSRDCSGRQYIYARRLHSSAPGPPSLKPVATTVLRRPCSLLPLHHHFDAGPPQHTPQTQLADVDERRPKQPALPLLHVRHSVSPGIDASSYEPSTSENGCRNWLSNAGDQRRRDDGGVVLEEVGCGGKSQSRWRTCA